MGNPNAEIDHRGNQNAFFAWVLPKCTEGTKSRDHEDLERQSYAKAREGECVAYRISVHPNPLLSSDRRKRQLERPVFLLSS